VCAVVNRLQVFDNNDDGDDDDDDVNNEDEANDTRTA